MRGDAGGCGGMRGEAGRCGEMRGDIVTGVELLHDAGRDQVEDGEQIAVPVATLDGLERGDDDRAIKQALLERVGALHLDCDLAAGVRRASVDLADIGEV